MLVGGALSVTAIATGNSYSLALDGLNNNFISLNLTLQARAGGCWPSETTVTDSWERVTRRPGI